MQVKEITEAVHRANTTTHLKNRINVAAELCDNMGDYPLLFRDFQTSTPGYTVLGKITNAENNRTIVKGGPNKVNQTKILELLNIDKPVFTKMIEPASTQGQFGDSHIFVPLAGAKSFWSPAVNDLGSSKGSPDQLAKTYKTGLPPDRTNNEIIFDCDMYYLINIQAFLKDFAGKANQEFIEKNKYSNVPLKIDPTVFNAHITNYKQLSWYLRNTAIDFLNNYEAQLNRNT